MRTKEQIDKEIANLHRCKTYIPATTIFGDDNMADVDRQIEFLRGELDVESDLLECDESERIAVLEAQAWVDGDSAEAPSEGWSVFAPK